MGEFEEAFVKALVLLRELRSAHSLCVQCGPRVGVDEDGCCAMCGATATGAWLDAFGARVDALLGVPRVCD